MGPGVSMPPPVAFASSVAFDRDEDRETLSSASVLLTLAHLTISGQPEPRCAETSDGLHCTGRQEGLHRCCACGSAPDDEPEPAEYDPGPKVDDQGGMSEYRHLSAGPQEEPW